VIARTLGSQDVEAVDLLDAGLAQRLDRLDLQLDCDRVAHLGAEALGVIERAEKPGREAGERQNRRDLRSASLLPRPSEIS